MKISVAAKAPQDKKPRKQSGVIPYRKKSGKIEVLLIRTVTGKNWGLPKGKIESHLTKKGSAQTEAFEEAGILGKVKDFVGEYDYTKGSTGRKQKVKVYLMKVANELSSWPESKTRERKWFKIEKAKGKVGKKIRLLLEEAEEMLG